MFAALTDSFRSGLDRTGVMSDIMAGLTVGVIALPLSMALAIAVGVAPQHGLYTAIIAGILIALTGGSRVNISGPTAAFVVVLLPIVHNFGLGGLLLSGMLAGLILIIMGASRLGGLIEIVPYPVTVGFTSGIAVVIATLQLRDFLGLDIQALDGNYVDKLAAIFSAIGTVDWHECLIGGLTFAILWFWPRLHSRIPGHLVALTVGALCAWLLGQFAADFNVATLGSRFHYQIDGLVGNGIPPLLPDFTWPWNLPDASGQPIGISFELLRQLMPAVITIAMLGAIESLLCAVVADGMSGRKHNPNDELIGQGIGNVLIPFFGGIPATAAIARTAASIKAGARTPLASVVHGLFILLSILLLTRVLAYIPMASLAALLLIVAWNMSEARHFIRIIRVAPRDDVIVLCLCFSLTILFDMTVAVSIGMGLAAILFIRRSIDLATTTKMSVNQAQHGDIPPEIVIYDIDGPLFFGSAHKAIKSIADVLPTVRVAIIDMSEVNMLDMSAIIAMESITALLKKHNVVLIINNLKPRMILKLRRAGIRLQHGRIYYSRTLPEALKKARKFIGGG